jgi:phosphoglycerate dehydrogenase-like enzyme
VNARWAIVGVGNIGKAVTRRARAFGMKVYGNDIVEIDHVFVSETGIEMTNLDPLSVFRFRFSSTATLTRLLITS